MAKKRILYNKVKHPKLIVDMMSQGASKTAVAAAIGITPKTLRNWAKDARNEGLQEAIELGMAASQAWWEKLGRDGITGQLDGKFNASAWIFTMKCRFREDWSDIQIVENRSPAQEMSDAELKESLKAKMIKLTKKADSK